MTHELIKSQLKTSHPGKGEVNYTERKAKAIACIPLRDKNKHTDEGGAT